MISRRESLKALGGGALMGLTGAVIVSTTSCAPTEVPAAEVDPIMDAIVRHRAVDDTINTMTGDEPEWEETLAAEASAYAAVCQIVPTTLDGICQKASYMAQVGVCGIPPEHLKAALASLAAAAASLGRAA